MQKFALIITLFLLTSLSFAARSAEPGSKEKGFKAGETLPDGRPVGTPKKELPATQADLEDMASGLREEIKAAKTRNSRRASYHRARAQVIYRTLVTERKLTPKQLSSMYEQLVSGSAIPSLAPDVDWAKRNGILIGRFGDLSSSSYECRQPLSLQRFTTALRRFGWQMSWFVFWMSFPGWIALAILFGLFIWWLLRRRRPVVPVGPAPVFVGPAAPPPAAPIGTPGVPNGAYRGGGYLW